MLKKVSEQNLLFITHFKVGIIAVDFHEKKNRIHHGCPVEIGKSQPEGPPVPVGNEARRVSHWNGGPEGWDFPFSTEHP